jgi:phospholipid/cholesterol/gamma-HCH transport system permease protein
LEQHAETREPSLEIDLQGVSSLDTAGAWLLKGRIAHLEGNGAQVKVTGLNPAAQALFDLVLGADDDGRRDLSLKPPLPLEGLGKAVHDFGTQAFDFLSFIGEIAFAVLALLGNPFRLRWRLVLNSLQAAGVAALPIVGLLTFLVGVVIAYQGSVILEQYGANIYIADLVGLAMLRELAPMITAIIVAGRTGAAYTAQIGTMRVTEEIDALRAMGISPVEVLVIPKLIALVIALPLLTVFADALGVLGGMLMAQVSLDVGPAAFVARLLEAVTLESYLIGIGKAPVFAAIIAAVGCFQGFRAGGSAESVGRQTTLSVVQSIFLVIVVDAAFSVVFSGVGI